MRFAGVGTHEAPRRLARGLIAIGVLTGGAVLGTMPARADGDRAAGDLVVAYALGQYDVVTSALSARHGLVADFAAQLRGAVAARLAGQPSEKAARERLVGAAVALEAARAIPPRADIRKMTESQWADRERLLEWGCALLREDPAVPAGPAERAWDLASLALFEQASGYPFYAYEGLWSEGQRHLSHLRSRVPDEPRWALGEAVLAEEAAGVLGYPLDDLPNDPIGAPRYDVRVRESATGDADLVLTDPREKKFPVDRRDFRVPLRDAVRGLSALRRVPPVAAEAGLHLGAIEVSLGQPGLALPHLDRAATAAGDPTLAYAAQFYRGAALMRMGQVQPAQAAFRAALVARPHAESATVALGWLLMLNEHRAEASALSAAELAAPGATVDPLAIYKLGDTRLWPVYIGDLRRALGPAHGQAADR